MNGGMYGAIVSKAFSEADKDKSGFIDKEETEIALNKYSKDLNIAAVTKEEVESYFKELDKDSNEKIDEKEFGKLIQMMVLKKKK